MLLAGDAASVGEVQGRRSGRGRVGVWLGRRVRSIGSSERLQAVSKAIGCVSPSRTDVVGW